jgi:hypothetical protein
MIWASLFDTEPKAILSQPVHSKKKRSELAAGGLFDCAGTGPRQTCEQENKGNDMNCSA